MHEMALAEGILDIALAEVKKTEATVIRKVGLTIGKMAGVETESLTTCFDAVTRGTIAEGALLVIEHAPIVARCLECGEEKEVEAYNFVCASCGGVTTLISGRELRVAYLDLD